MKLGIVVRADNTGLGNQTKELFKMLNPERILIIDSSSFNNNSQNYHWYEGSEQLISKGIPDNRTVTKFISGLDIVISCETFYNKNFIGIARKNKVKTVLQYNFEFLDAMSDPNAWIPDVLLAPSLWRIDEVEEKFGDKCIVTHLPPPTDEKLFESNRIINKERSNKILHIGGKAAIYDRNGTNSVIEMLKYSKKDYELVVKTQSKLDIDCKDERLTILTNNEKNREDLYSGYDAMILPRRYAGLCLPMNEALMSGLPVFMTDISPNNLVLPKEWLADSRFVRDFMARIGIQLFEVDPEDLATTVDNYFDNNSLSSQKKMAFDIANKKYSYESLKQKYIDLFKSI